MSETSKLRRHIRGKRPQFFDDPAVDKLLGIVTALAQEVSVLRDRHDAVERILDSKGTMTRAELEAFEADPDAEAERKAEREAYLQRVFRVIRREGGEYTADESERFVEELGSSIDDTNR